MLHDCWEPEPQHHFYNLRHRSRTNRRIVVEQQRMGPARRTAAIAVSRSSPYGQHRRRHHPMHRETEFQNYLILGACDVSKIDTGRGVNIGHRRACHSRTAIRCCPAAAQPGPPIAFEVATIGHDREVVNARGFAGLLRHRRQLSPVVADVGDLVRDDQVVLVVDRSLDVVANDAGATAAGGH